MSNKTFAVELQHFRKDHDLTQDKLAEVVGVSSLSVWQWLHGKYEPKEHTLEKVRKAMARMSHENKTANTEKKKKVKSIIGKFKKKATIKKLQMPTHKSNIGIKALQASIDNLTKRLDEHIHDIIRPEVPVLPNLETVQSNVLETGAEPAFGAESVVLLKELVQKLNANKVEGSVRGYTCHVIEWSNIHEICERASNLLGMEYRAVASAPELTVAN